MWVDIYLMFDFLGGNDEYIKSANNVDINDEFNLGDYNNYVNINNEELDRIILSTNFDSNEILSLKGDERINETSKAFKNHNRQSIKLQKWIVSQCSDLHHSLHKCYSNKSFFSFFQCRDEITAFENCIDVTKVLFK